MNEFSTQQQYKQIRELAVSGEVRSLVCFCVDTSGSMNDPLGLGQGTKITLLTRVLRNMIQGFRKDPKMRHAVALSIVTYNKYAQIKEDFQDAALYEDLEESCSFPDVHGQTNMTNGLNTSLRALHEMQNLLLEKDQASNTPLLVFMTDGEPTGDKHWKEKFGEIRELVTSEQLHVFPVGIGDMADMRLISNLLYPFDKVPWDFSSKYRMLQESDFIRVFDEIRKIVLLQGERIADEINAAPAYIDENIQDTQSGGNAAATLLSFISD